MSNWALCFQKQKSKTVHYLLSHKVMPLQQKGTHKYKCKYIIVNTFLKETVRDFCFRKFSFNLASLFDPFDVLFSQVKLWTPTPPRDVSVNSYPVITLAKDCSPNTY